MWNKRELKERDSCCVADQYCEAPANTLNECLPLRLHTCYHCGESVCSACSSRRKYNGGIRRLCNTCQIEIDNGDSIVMKRLLARVAKDK